ncbi:MAG: ATP-binding protein [Kineosporiaceae bacterium]
MTPRAYLPRVIDLQLATDLRALGAVVVEGPRASGKTRTAEQHAASVVRLDADPQMLTAARIDPFLVLEGPTPRLIDEWHLVPGVWNAVRRAVDDRGGVGHFILTGSAMPVSDDRRHSGAGRMVVTRMRTMSSHETGASTGRVSLAALFGGEPARASSDRRVPDYVDDVVRGGWPELVDASPDRVRRFLDGYLDLVIERDVPALGGRRDPIRLRRFLRAYAELTAHPVSLRSLVARALGTDAHDQATLTWHTADTYLDIAQRLMIVEDVPMWSTRLRSRATLTELPKRHLSDPALATALMSTDATGLLRDLNTFGFLFESLVTRDLRVYAQASDAAVFHYRERSGHLEVDLVVERRDGAWIGVEVKLTPDAVDAAAASLRRLADTRVEMPPAALVVVTAGPYAYRREDGVDVVPLATLGP